MALALLLLGEPSGTAGAARALRCTGAALALARVLHGVGVRMARVWRGCWVVVVGVVVGGGGLNTALGAAQALAPHWNGHWRWHGTAPGWHAYGAGMVWVLGGKLSAALGTTRAWGLHWHGHRSGTALALARAPHEVSVRMARVWLWVLGEGLNTALGTALALHCMGTAEALAQALRGVGVHMAQLWYSYGCGCWEGRLNIALGTALALRCMGTAAALALHGHCMRSACAWHGYSWSMGGGLGGRGWICRWALHWHCAALALALRRVGCMYGTAMACIWCGGWERRLNTALGAALALHCVGTVLDVALALHGHCMGGGSSGHCPGHCRVLGAALGTGREGHCWGRALGRTLQRG